MSEPKQGKRNKPNAPGEDVRFPVTISTEEATLGLVIEIDYDALDSCSSCEGHGLPHTQQIEKCPRCESKLHIRRSSTFVLPDQCGNCGWKGFPIKCEVCNGSGQQLTSKSLVVKIPAGVKNGTRLRIEGKGGTRKGSNGSGDLFVIVGVSSSERFDRNYSVVVFDEPELFSRNAGSSRTSKTASDDSLDEPFDRLLELADPMLFRKNPFRTLGLSVYASDREIKKHVEKLQIMARIGDGQLRVGGPLALDPPPDESALRSAVHDLRDPERRLIYEFFWLWPVTRGENDQALVELSSQRIKPAIECWEKIESHSDIGSLATHNLAVLYHAAAFDLEYDAQSKPLSKETKALQDAYWHQAFRRWRDLTRDDRFWGLFNSRVRELDEPQLTPATVRRFQLTMPTALLSMTARLAVSAAERGDKTETNRHRRLMNESDLGASANERALSRALSATGLRITRMCERTESEVKGREETGYEATRKLLEEAKPLLIMLDDLLPAGNRLRDDARDQVAQTALDCQIPFGNKTENWKLCVELLELTKPYPVSASIKSRIEENLKVVTENLRLKTLIACWFCKEKEGDVNATMEVKMYGDVKRFSTGLNSRRVEWRNATVSVPRCVQCLATHKRTNKLIVFGSALGLLAGLVICSLVWLIAGINDQTADPPIVFGSVFIIVALLLLGLDIGDQLAKCSTPEGIIHRSHSVVMVGVIPAMGYPGVEDMKSKGWIIGSKPSTS